MRAFRLLNVAVFSVLIAVSAALYGQDDKPQQEEPKRQDEAKPAKPDKNEPKQQDKQSRDEMKSDRQPQEHGRAAGKSARIPDDKFRAQFGRSHTFRAQRPEIVNGQPRFQYGGYSFVIVDAWPVDWAYTDDCYIDDVDGEYFLFDLRHPGIRIALTVVL